MMIRNKHDKGEFYSNSGNRYHITYTSRITDIGTVELVETGKECIVDYIQSFADSCNINNIIRRFASGEVDILQKVQGSYGDFTSLPSSYAELLQSVIDGENYFNSLPIDIKKKFGSSFYEWFSSIGSESWFDNMNIQRTAETSVEEVSSDS